ncbi:MAG TPA: hypothetical protein VFA04_27475 [Bryobacteraceae bacterium]|nr:hypothetical protein [Bryobacteraceae bacterium]
MKMPRVSEEMRRVAAMLEDELRGWPGVSLRPMFGMTGLYRGEKIFAALPRTRSIGGPNSLILRFDPLPPALAQRMAADPRIGANRPGARWCSFEVASPEDLNDALAWLGDAYEHAATAVNRTPAPSPEVSVRKRPASSPGRKKVRSRNS